MFEADLVFSCGENNFLPVVDVWLVIDVLRATTVMTRWFELGGTELYPVKSPDEARRLVLELQERGSSPLLMGEVNGIPPEGFDMGNSPLELSYELIQEHYCGVMSTTNGTVALNEAFSSGSPVIAASFRNISACLDHALTLGDRIGILCSGRKSRPSWE
ncbi:MAG: 2-phosphosulfolactate phosphatase, partial [Synergistaceae bacterium]|nr:2-phosphosulfolactate phosphatase [Synergistaceae bacterium]